MKRLPLMRALLTLLVGFVVLTTAPAQTSTAPNEGSRLTYDSLLGSYDFSWWGQPGRTYFLQHSDDLSTWEYLPLIESGTDGPLSWGFTSTADKFFLRLRYSDIPTSDPFDDDFDGDKVGNWDELMQGTDPLAAADTDTSGLPDDWEKFYFGHLGVAPNATAPGGGMTNHQHFVLGSNPNNPPATLDQNADTLLYPADESQLLVQNGNFSQGDSGLPSLGSNSWWPYPSGIPGWTAISGSIVELQQIDVNAAAGAGQYCELDSHWPTDDHTGPSDHGIQQTVNLARGHYLLVFDYRGRFAGADSFTVKLRAGTATPVLLAAKNGAAPEWKRATVGFDVTGGDPNSTTLPVTLLFDIADAADSYGAFIDNVILLHFEVIPKETRAANADQARIYFTASLAIPDSVTPIGEGGTIEWEVESGDGTLVESETTIENGLSTVALDISNSAVGANHKVKARIKRLSSAGPEIDSGWTNSGAVEMYAGHPASISVTKNKSTFRNDGTDTIEIEAEILDADGNPVLDGTTVDWNVEGTDADFVVELLESETTNGKARAVLLSSL